MTKILILLCCAYFTFASQHTHVIPVENYETELQDLGQHTESHETPVKVIKITKTIAVKIPVPYPVKVIEKVPYPVHVNKPYPVHVPHVIQLPKERTVKLGPHHEQGEAKPQDDYQAEQAPAYDAPSGHEHSFAPLTEHIHVGDGFNYGNNQHVSALGNDYSQGAPGNSYGAPNEGHHSYAGEDGHNYDESKQYNAVKPFHGK
ncbi:uncharacterized protein LOC133518299 [Cydia pomonella]|uniref:uncharacterized protein LOC133518299 n=1 Tax=Cydia pomonella TaxID=82600 RepID=UPI002ADE2C45|nr:uncharacterized protein LOC133518299 [Cydia pomonella]